MRELMMKYKIHNFLRIQMLFLIVMALMTNTFSYAAEGDHVVYDVRWISDNSAKVTLSWSDETNNTPIRISGWSVNDNKSVTISYNQGENVATGYDSRTVTDEDMECPCIFILRENVRNSDNVIFPDLPDREESILAINHLYGLGIIKGYPDGSFKPDGQVTRAEFSKMLFVAGDMVQDINSPITFNDVSDSHWAQPYIYTLATKEIVNGKGDGVFDPEGTITIGEVLAIIDRSFELTGDYDSYSQALTGHWSDGSFYEMVKKGIVKSKDDYYSPYMPDVLATREDCTVMLSRVLSTYYQMK